MEYHAILSEGLEDQLKAIEWAKAEQKRIVEEKGEHLSKELREDNTVHIKSTRLSCIFCSILFSKLLATL